MHALVPSLCVSEPLTGVRRPRNFAVLLFGREPSRFFPGAVTFFSRYPGVDRSEPTAERHELTGALVDQARRLLSLLDGEVVRLFEKTDVDVPDVETYPRRALYEAAINALVHRDYEMVDPTMRRTMASIGSPPPEFDADEARVTCVLRANPRRLVSRYVPAVSKRPRGPASSRRR